MRKGSTENYKFNFDNIDVLNITDVRVAFSQGKVLVVKTTADVFINAETNSIVVPLSQEDTLKFEGDKAFKIQLKFKDVESNVETTKIFTDFVYPLLDDAII